MRRRVTFAFVISIIVLIGLVGISMLTRNEPRFNLDLSTPRMIIEAQPKTEDMNITSGGALIIVNGRASTLNSETRPSDPWYIPSVGNQDEFKRRYPQIVFRAVTPERSINWSNYEVSLSLIPTKHVVSNSSAVDGTNGIFLFFHYRDQDNLYVGGITKDGRIFIKRKADGVYRTIVEKTIFAGTYTANANLISPFENSEITLTGTVQKMENGSVKIDIKAQIKDGPEIVVNEAIVGVDIDGLFTSGKAGFRLDSIEALISNFRVIPIN